MKNILIGVAILASLIYLWFAAREFWRELNNGGRRRS